jgi:hypothetical protein
MKIDGQFEGGKLQNVRSKYIKFLMFGLFDRGRQLYTVVGVLSAMTDDFDSG